MKVFIPAIGTRLKLIQPWSFTLYDEHRNRKFWADMNNGIPVKIPYSYCQSTGQTLPLTLPPGTILSVDRLYIRKGQSGFDSISFRVIKGSPIPTGRFWAKLDEVNTGLEATVIP